MISVAEGDERGSHAAFRGQFLRGAGKHKEWFSIWFFADVDVAPAHRFADAGAECFGDGFFPSETRGQMARRKFHRHRILNFAIGENAMKKAFAEAVDRVLDARAFHQVDTNAEHAHLEHEPRATLPRFVLPSVQAALAFSEVVIQRGELDRLWCSRLAVSRRSPHAPEHGDTAPWLQHKESSSYLFSIVMRGNLP
jgi:hypothetical protein